MWHAANQNLLRPEDRAAESERVLLSDLFIRTKDKQLVPLVPNPVQELYLDLLAETHEEFDWRNGIYTLRGVREDILKARQEGMSTLWLALYFLDTINVPLTQTIILAHDIETTNKLFSIVHRFYAHLPPQKKRPKRYSNRREIELADIDSAVFVGTAGGTAVGRGGTVNNAHLSERAWWNDKDGADIELGLLESIPMDGNVTRETTANGLNSYYQERQEQERGESVFRPRFFGWPLMPEYRLPVEEGFAPTVEESKLVEDYDLDYEQLNWRREKKKTTKDKFAQEYPINATEAFLVSGNPYFNREILWEINNRIQQEEFNPKEGIEIPEKWDRLDIDDWRNRRLLSPVYGEGLLKIWDTPLPDRTYVISADPAEGLNDFGDHDFCSASVWDAADWIQVAHLHGRWEMVEFGMMQAALGWWYNTALVGVERNNHGHAVLSTMMHVAKYPTMIHIGSGGIYMHQEFDENKKPLAMRPGFPITPKSKFEVLDGLAASIEYQDLKFRSRQTVAELLAYVKKPGKKAGADGKGHDDCVSDAAIGDALLKMRPLSRPRMAPLNLNMGTTAAQDAALLAAQRAGGVGARESADAMKREIDAMRGLSPELREQVERFKKSKGGF